VTVCTKNRECLFGEIVDGKMILNEHGIIVEKCWKEIPKHFNNVLLDICQIMSNHIHGIIIIKQNVNFVVGNKNFCSLQVNKIPWQTKLSKSLSSIIRGFKIGVTKQCRKHNKNIVIWQKSFYDHIIRNEESLDKIRQYIRDNPKNWNKDRNNPKNIISTH